MTNEEIILLSMYTGGGFLIGLVSKHFIIPLLQRITSKTKIKSDDLILNTIGKWVIPWFTGFGLYLALKQVNFPEKYHGLAENALLIAFLFSVTVILATIISGMVKIKAGDHDSVLPSSSIISKIAKVAIYIFGLILILQSQGVSVTGMLTALGVGGLAVALALQNTLANLFAGLQIISSGKVNPGDFIQLTSGEEGFVQDISWRSTTIKAMSNHMIIVPNSKMADMVLNNYYLPGLEITFKVFIAVAYDSDLDMVERVTKEVIKDVLTTVEGGVLEDEPVIRFYEFGDSSIKLKAFLTVSEYTFQFAMAHEFIKRLHTRYRKEGIEIPFPIRTLIMKKEDERGEENPKD